jgi:tetrahydromethanopterin S-methyltransferase subunit F
MKISFQVNNRQLLWAAFLLLIPDTFFWYTSLGSGWSNPSESFSFLSSDTYLSASAIVYLLIFFALFVKGERIWKPYFMVLAVFYGLYRYISLADTWNKEGTAAKTILNNLFVKFEDQWPLQLLSTIAIIIIIGLSVNDFKKVNSIAKALWNSAFTAGKLSAKTIIGTAFYVAVVVYGVITEFIALKDEAAYRSQQFLDAGFQWTLAFGWIFGILMILLYVVSITVMAVFFFTTVHIWWKELAQLWQSLKDFRINKYVTRLITGYIYTYLFIFWVVIMALVTPIAIFGFYGATYGNEIEPILAGFILAGVLFGILVTITILLVIRLLVEVSVALIHIAQNTSR